MRAHAVSRHLIPRGSNEFTMTARRVCHECGWTGFERMRLENPGMVQVHGNPVIRMGWVRNVKAGAADPARSVGCATGLTQVLLPAAWRSL